MNFKTTLSLSTSVLALVMSIMPAQSASVGTNSELSAQRMKRRSFYNPWSTTSGRNSLSLYQASNTYKPAPYAVPHPYYIPVYGAPGRPLIFYPPQPVYVNPGAPQDNPLTAQFGGPAYLPPKDSPYFPTTENPAPFRLPDYDAQQIWSNNVDDNVGKMPLNSLNGGKDQEKEYSVEPTRSPAGRRPSQPPLVHGPSGSDKESDKNPFSPNQSPQPQNQQVQTTTVSPQIKGPSNCVWAIVSCCSAAKPASFSQNCFEQRGCPGPFWGMSPCEGEFARAAINTAMNYYSTNSRNKIAK